MRQAWLHDGCAHIEVCGFGDASPDEIHRLEQAVDHVPGVHWSAWNAVLGRLVVSGERTLRLADLIAAVEPVEREHAAPASLWAGDLDPLLGNAIALGGDLLGAGAGLLGRLLRATPIPAEVPSLVAALEHVPQLGRALASRIGAVRTDVGMTLLNAGVSAAAHTPAGPLADAAMRMMLVRERLAHREVWQRRGPELGATEAASRAAALPVPPRPGTMPDGPIETYASRGTVVTLLAAAALLPMRQGGRRAARALGIGAQKAGWVGREAYSAELGRILARRGIALRDPAALRHLDRIDTVIIDANLLTTGTLVVDDVVAITGTDADARQQAQQLLADGGARLPARQDEWALGPPAQLGVQVPVEARERLHRAHHYVAALVRSGTLVAVAALRDELDPLAVALAAAAAKVGRLVLAGGSADLHTRLHATDRAGGGAHLAESVRQAQARGHGVLLIAARNDVALAAADCGVGVLTTHRRPPWGAHALCGPGLEPAWLILEAAIAARRVSERSARLAVLGSAAGALLGVVDPRIGSARAGLLPPGLATLASVATGVWSATSLGRLNAPEPEDVVPWHALPAPEVLDRLDTTPTGLDQDQAAAREVSPAAPARSPVRGMLRTMLEELDTPLTAPLAAGAGVSAFAGSTTDAGLVMGVLVANAVLGGAQRHAAERALGRLRTSSALQARVHRGDETELVPADRLVPGDVVALEAGDAVPADCRLIDATGLEVDESGLTGESRPVAKNAAPCLARAVADRTSMVYAETTVAAGTARAVVVSVGARTEAGRSAAIAGEAETPKGVEERLRRLTSASLPAAAAGAAAVLGAGMLRGRARPAFDSAVAMGVAAIPEGLPFVATVAQLAAARRLSRHNVLVRRLPAMEALGRVDVVCFDKTGTLTEGRIDVRFVSDGEHSEPVDELAARLRPVLAAALRATPLNGNGEVLPHPTDRAVAAGGERAGIGIDEGASRWHLIRELPFEPGRGYHAVLGRYTHGQLISVKGAPEAVLPRCESWRRHGRTAEIRESDRHHINDAIDALALRGLRVLAVAERRASPRQSLDNDRVERLEFVGLLGLADPVRPTAAEAVRQLRRAGVEVIMLTGDHPSTAESIAAELELRVGRGVVTGPDLDDADDDKLAVLAQESAVFARVSPGHKVAIIRALRRAGRVVAVTGDGANDAPAIRLADVGIALGGSGTTAARQAADIIVTDDRIETIVRAVIEGRALWASVRDAVAVLQGGNLGEIAFTVASSAISPQPPLNARQLLLVNMVTDLLPAMALAARPPRGVSPEDLVAEGPDASLGASLTCDLARRAVATSVATATGWLAARLTGTRERASTVALACLINGQLAQTALASRGDPLVLASTGASVAATVGAVQYPPVSRFFGCRPLGPVGWGIVTGAAGLSAALGALLPCRVVEAVGEVAERLNPAHSPPHDGAHKGAHGGTPAPEGAREAQGPPGAAREAREAEAEGAVEVEGAVEEVEGAVEVDAG